MNDDRMELPSRMPWRRIGTATLAKETPYLTGEQATKRVICAPQTVALFCDGEDVVWKFTGESITDHEASVVLAPAACHVAAEWFATGSGYAMPEDVVFVLDPGYGTDSREIRGRGGTTHTRWFFTMPASGHPFTLGYAVDVLSSLHAMTERLATDVEQVTPFDERNMAHVAGAGQRLIELLDRLTAATAAGSDQLRTRQLQRFTIELEKAVEYFNAGIEHEVDASLDIFDRLMPGVLLARRVVEVMRNPRAGERATVGEVIERLRQFPDHLEVRAGDPSNPAGHAVLDGTARQLGERMSAVVLGTKI